VQNQPGNGVLGAVDGKRIVAGTANWLVQNDVILNENLMENAAGLEPQGSTSVHVAIKGRHCGLISISDQLREDAKTLVQDLRNQGIHMRLLSGDRQPVAQAIADQLGGMQVIAEVLPQDKDRIIRELQQHGRKVAMVGDGVNDAPALIRADVGIALGSGTDVSGESADIVLMSNELHKVSLASQLSRRTLRTVRQNIGISFTYNIIMVPLAMAAFITRLSRPSPCPSVRC
jgi:Cu2+-exporting ATPase